MMQGLITEAGSWRSSSVGVIKGGVISHMASPADRAPYLMDDLFQFLKTETHPLIKGCVFHYEFEFIHPFQDGNGRMGRFWHSLMLYDYHRGFEYIPVESMIKDHQSEYYKLLEQCDHPGNSTLFIEFSLEMILKAMEEFLTVFRPKPTSGVERLENFQQQVLKKLFSRKDYLTFYKSLSTATASRDLKGGVERGTLIKTGDKALAVYSFG